MKESFLVKVELRVGLTEQVGIGRKQGSRHSRQGHVMNTSLEWEWGQDQAAFSGGFTLEKWMDAVEPNSLRISC